ncbi:MAG: HD domain-containing phosphohydrolase, partial [Anaerovorax sp.]
TGESMPWLTPEEVESLAISYGTLTAKERKVMEDHVVITQRLLNKIKFSKEYSSVPLYAAAHHEKLNGKGYPNGLEANQLPIGTRILTIIDVFEALTAKDRPYKQPMSIERAFDVLDKMIADGELDNELVDLLKEWRQL